MLRPAAVAECDERVSAQEPRIVPRDVEPVVVAHERLRLEPVDEVDVPRVARRLAGAALLDAAVPRADVLADVAAVDLGAERGAVVLGDRGRRLRPVGEALRRVEGAGLVERARRARVDADPALAAVRLEGRRALQLLVADERPEHDPRAVRAGDQHRVLPVEPDAAARGRFTVDVLVRVDEHAIAPADRAAERVEPLAQLCVGVRPRVAREASVPRLERRLGLPVAERRRDDAARSRQQRLGMARALRLRHRELHLGEQAARAALDDLPLRLDVRGRGRHADRIEPELRSQPADVVGAHARIVPA